MRFGLLVIALCCAAVPLPAAAQEPPVLTVLGLSTDEGDDALMAENLTAVLRRAVDESRSVRGSGREATLAQMSLAFGCEDPPDTTCLQQIGQEMQSKLLVYGQVSRARRGSDPGDFRFRINVRLFDVDAGREVRANTTELPRTSNDIEDLRDPARRMVSALLAGETGTLEVLVEAPDGSIVRIDGELAGEIGGGTLTVTDLQVGEHRVAIEAEGFEPYDTRVRVGPGEATRLRARLVSLSDTPPPGRGGGGGGVTALQWIGVGALVMGAVLGGLAIAWAADVQSTNDSSAWTEARYRFQVVDPTGPEAVCDANVDSVTFDGIFHVGELRENEQPRASDGSPVGDGGSYTGEGGTELGQEEIDSACTHQWGQWVLGGLGVAAGVVGTYLVFGTSSGTPRSEPRDTGFLLLPVFGREQAGLGLHLAW